MIEIRKPSEVTTNIFRCKILEPGSHNSCVINYNNLVNKLDVIAVTSSACLDNKDIMFGNRNSVFGLIAIFGEVSLILFRSIDDTLLDAYMNRKSPDKHDKKISN